jgi:hypothetical protein
MTDSLPPFPPPDAEPGEPRASRRSSRQLFKVGAFGVAALLAYYAFTAQVDDPLLLYEGLAILFLAVLPSLLWARRGGDQLPVFEVLLLTTANAYALPVLNGHADLKVYPTDLISLCAGAVLLFQITAISTYLLIRGRPGRTPFYTDEIMGHGMENYIGYGLVLSTIYTFVSIFYESSIPYEINGILRAAFYGIGLVSVFIQSRRWGMKTLRPRERSVLVATITVQVLIQFSTLFLVGGISIIVLAVVGYVAGGRRLPIVPVIAVLALVALLHNGKSVMRNKYWIEGQDHQQVAFTGLLPFYAEWIENGLSTGSEGDQALAKKLFDRTSLMQILCLVASYTPEHQPYLDGKTYAQIPGQFIPRFFWPDKPPGHISTYTLAIYYGLQNEEATQTTTIGFGMISEAYANFGFFGVGILACALGAFYKKVHIATANSPLLSYPGLYLIILLAWSFQTEWTLSIWLSSMFQAGVAVMGIPFVLRNFLG